MVDEAARNCYGCSAFPRLPPLDYNSPRFSRSSTSSPCGIGNPPAHNNRAPDCKWFCHAPFGPGHMAMKSGVGFGLQIDRVAETAGDQNQVMSQIAVPKTFLG